MYLRVSNLAARIGCALLLLYVFAGEPALGAPGHFEGAYGNGARWSIDMPEHWNGTLLLYARGYSAGPSDVGPDTAPRGARDWLLSHGYALAASSYSGIGWALQEAPADQLDVLNTFTVKFGAPKRAIAWGNSMGGLTSVALAERRAAALNGAISMCGSVSGSLAMLNTALDGAYAFKTLVAPTSDIRIVSVDDDVANAARVRAALEAAWQTPQGRARVALAAALAQLPQWSDPKAAEPAERDYQAQAEEARKTFVMGVFLPRVDQEMRSGGVYSWNTGIDYREQLQRSGRVDFVRDLYRRAGLDLDRDIQALNDAPRIAADPRAVAYMRANYVPTGQLQVPLLVMQTTGDGLTVPATHGGLREIVRAAGKTAELGELYVRGAGHCAFTLAENVAALRTLEQRLDTGRWHLDPAQVSRSVKDVASEARFVAFQPPALSRSCDAIGPCQGEPAAALPIAESAVETSQLFDDYVRSSVYVTARDGTRLAVAIFRPVRQGTVSADKLPVILVHALGQRIKRLEDRAELGLEDIVKRGYVVAWMEPRGFGASFGAATPFLTRQNGRDAADVVEWLAAQPWSTGRIAMYGLSNLGYIQWLTAIERPAHLVAIAPSVANPNFYYQLYPNGVSSLAGAPTRSGAGPLGEPVDEDIGPAFLLNAAAHAQHANNLALGDGWLSNMARDQINPLLGYAPGLTDSVFPENLETVRAAKLQIFQHAGWFDSSPGGQLAAWKALGGRITIGAWRHGLFAANEGGALIRSELLPWFDRVLKSPAGVDESPPVHYQTINASASDEWNYSATWPLPSQRITPFFLLPGNRSLSMQSSDREVKDVYRIDPELKAFDGKFNRLARVWDGDMAAGIDSRGLTYTTEPLPADTEVTGHPVAHLWISADAPDANVLVYLEDVNEAGKSWFVTDGVVRASHAHRELRQPWSALGIPYLSSRTEDLKLLAPGEPTELVFDLNPTSYLFRKGSRIRITITGGERNAYEQPSGFDFAHPPTLTLYGGASRASFVALPIVPVGSKYFSGQVRKADRAIPARMYVSDEHIYVETAGRWQSCRRYGDELCAGSIGTVHLNVAGNAGSWHARLRGDLDFASDQHERADKQVW